jgi:hypothetical protein
VVGSPAEATAKIERVKWPKSYRIIRSIFPAVDLFEDISDPADWEALASAESKTNPRVWDQIGNMALVPPERRVGGEGASMLMAPFFHCSIHRQGRFSDGSFGVYYAASDEETAIREVAYHHGTAMAATSQPEGWTSQFRVLVGSVDADLHDVSHLSSVLDPSDYTAAQKVGHALRAQGSNGVVYPSVRALSGLCIGVFWPDVLSIPIQADHYDFHWDGMSVDRVRNITSKKIFAL